jgi:energy-coupling factor transporter ATP-binding protein EcfA2
MARERRIVMILGAQGSGKSTLARCLFGAVRERGGVVDGIDPNGAIRGFEMPLDVEAWLSERLPTHEPVGGRSRFVPASRKAELLVFDDADRYIPKRPRDASRWRQIALTNRHADVDVLLTGRRLQAFPDELVSGIDFLYLFQLSRADVNAARRLLAFTDVSLRVPLSENEEARMAAEMHAPGVASTERYLTLLRENGLNLKGNEDLSDLWTDTLVKRLAMYRGLRDTTVAKFGEAHFAAWDSTYSFFVGLFSAGKLGGARIVARKG